MTGDRPTAPQPLPTWLQLAPDQRHVTLADLRAGVDHRPPRMRRSVVEPSRNAAILLPLFEEDGELCVVLIERAHDIGSHRGDIAFPGGTVDEGEAAPDAAVRETFEELGIPSSAIEVIAALDNHPTLSGYVIMPHIGILTVRPTFDHHSPEVARALVATVSDLMADGAYWEEPWPDSAGSVLSFFAVPGGVAWGTTGDLLKELLEIALTGRARLQALERTTRS